MLNPDSRSLYTETLTPPPGFVFDEAIGTTYSLDPATLLGVPVHLALASRPKGGDGDVLALLEGLRRVADRMTVYGQRGRMIVPRGQHVLYGLLEPLIVEVASPGGGAFHPKLWILRFVSPDHDEVLLRLLVLSRNLTGDRSWDLSLRLEGVPRGRSRAANRALADLVRDLPSFALGAIAEARRAQAERLADEVRRTDWAVPEPFDSVRFHVMREKGWYPAPSRRLAVISPFLTAEALSALAGTTKEPAVLVSRPETLAALEADPAGTFEHVFTLDNAAESEDGEEALERDTMGLHAKVYLAEDGGEIHLYVGSANATSAALMAGRNVEVLAELTGRRYRVGGVDALLGEDGLGGYLAPWSRESPALDDETDAERLAENSLERTRHALAAASISVDCMSEAGRWRLRLRAENPVQLDDVASIRAWPITVRDELAAEALCLGTGGVVDLGAFAAASVTGLVGFDLRAASADVRLRFALNLPLENPPQEREAAVLRTVLDNREGFLRYLLLLLGDFTEEPDWIKPGGGDGAGGDWRPSADASLPLLEEMTRAFSRDPARLHEVRRIVERLHASEETSDVVPPDFIGLWEVFARALEEGRR